MRRRQFVLDFASMPTVTLQTVGTADWPVTRIKAVRRGCASATPRRRTDAAKPALTLILTLKTAAPVETSANPDKFASRASASAKRRRQISAEALA
jgi:hypothetical protein